MALNKNLLLPSISSSTAIVSRINKSSSLVRTKGDDKKSSLKGVLISIRDKLIQIDDILKATTKIQTED